MRLWLAATLGVAVACGGAGKGSSSVTTPRDDGVNGGLPDEVAGADAGPDKPLDFEEIELGTSGAYIPLLKVGAVALGCALIAEEPDPPAVAYQCEQGILYAKQVGSTLRYACEHISKEQCNALLERVNKKVLEAAGGE